MKHFIVTLFFLTSLLGSAKTWIEVIEEAKLDEDSISYISEIESEDSDSYRAALKHHRLILKALDAQPADLKLGSPIDSFVTSLIELWFSQKSLLYFRSESGQWNQIPEHLGTMQKFRDCIWNSKPSMVEIMVSSINTIIICDLLEKLQSSPEIECRGEVFDQLHLHWLPSRVYRKDFLIAENGERQYTQAVFVDLKSWIREFSKEYNSVPFSVPEHLREAVKKDALLELPYEPQTSLKKARESLQRDFEWIRSGLAPTAHPDYQRNAPKRALKYYQSHPNGLFEIVCDAAQFVSTPQIIELREEKDLEQRLLWIWLGDERQGKKLITRELLLSKLTKTEKARVAKLNLSFDFNARTISRPKIEEREFDEAKKIEVPNLFSN